MVKYNQIIIFNLVWTLLSFQHWRTLIPDIFPKQHTIGYILSSLPCIFYFSNFLYNKFCFSLLLPISGSLEIPLWWKRTGTHNKAELLTYLWPYHLTGKVRAFQSLFITLHQLSILWKLLPDTQFPWNHRQWQPCS